MSQSFFIGREMFENVLLVTKFPHIVFLVDANAH